MEIREINQLLTERAEDVAAILIPAGRKAGREWEAGSVDGEQGKSLKCAIRFFWTVNPVLTGQQIRN